MSSCNHPEHSHDDISSSRKLIALNHVEALAHFAHFEVCKVALSGPFFGF